MSRYKLRPVPVGSYIYLDNGGQAFRADTEAAAREMWADYMPLDTDELDRRGLRPIGGRPRIVYARDIEAGDAHDDAERGDTTYDLCDIDDPANPPDGIHLFWELGPEPGRAQGKTATPVAG